MPRVRGSDEAERQDEGGNPTVDVRHVFADRGHAPTGRGTRQAARRASRSACGANDDSRALRKRTAWRRNIRPAIPAVQGETPHGDGGRHVHEPRLVSGHSYRRRKRRDAGMQRCPNESKAAYMALFSRIPAPDVLITNGLRGAESACREIWPSTRIRRCLVHVQRNTRTDLTFQTSFRRSHYSTF